MNKELSNLKQRIQFDSNLVSVTRQLCEILPLILGVVGPAELEGNAAKQLAQRG